MNTTKPEFLFRLLPTGYTPGSWDLSSSTLVVAIHDKRDCAIICNTMDLSRISKIGIVEAAKNARLISRAPDAIELMQRTYFRLLCMDSTVAGQIATDLLDELVKSLDLDRTFIQQFFTRQVDEYFESL